MKDDVKQHISSFAYYAYRCLLRLLLFCYHALLLLIKTLPKRHHKRKDRLTILATGTFYSDHWLITHLRPMAQAENCEHIIMVAASPVPVIDNVSAAYAPIWLQKLAGQVGARLLYFCWLAIKQRPDVLVGFHLLLNGLFVALLAKLIAAKSVYICGGGPREVAGGGINTENRIFRQIGQADECIEAELLKAVNEMDLVISMGTSAIKYFKNSGVASRFEIVPGGFDDSIFTPCKKVDKEYDLILVGRLSQVKRVDRFLQAVKLAQQKLPSLNAVIVGDGPDKTQLQNLARELDITDNVDFVGWQNSVDIWLKKSKCFVLTSDSEGLSQALIQAMMTGLPAITSMVGDLGDLVKDGQNGYLVSSLTATDFADSFVKLLTNDHHLQFFSANALCISKRYSVQQVTLQWQEIFASFTK